jgi:hypothetical protein
VKARAVGGKTTFTKKYSKVADQCFGIRGTPSFPNTDPVNGFLMMVPQYRGKCLFADMLSGFIMILG